MLENDIIQFQWPTKLLSSHFVLQKLKVTFLPQVFCFVKTVCQRTLPEKLLGSNSNWRIFFRNLQRYFMLRRSEFLTLQMMTKGIKPSHCTWMFKRNTRPQHVSRSFSDWQLKTLESLILWIISELILPLVKACFYVTESAMHRSRVFYYRRDTWTAIETLAKDVCFGKDFIQVKKDVVEDAIEKKIALGCAKIRFIPKANKIRPIINLRRPVVKPGGRKCASTNVRLQRLFSVLKFLQKQDSGLLGSTVGDLDEVRQKLRGFLERIKDCEPGNLYFVASDIERCFDTIPHDQLITVVKNAMKDDEYLVRKFCTTSYITHKKIVKPRRRIASDDRDYKFFPDFLKVHLQSKECKVSNAIVTDSVYYAHEEKEDLVALLKKHIKESYVQIGDKYYHHVRGMLKYLDFKIANALILSCTKSAP